MKCSVPCCESRRDTAIGKITFFEIPEDIKLKKAWLNIIFNEAKRYKLDLKLPDNAVVCEKHFKKADFSISTKRKKLLPNSIPTIFSGDTIYKLLVPKKRGKTLTSYKDLSLKTTDVDKNSSEPCIPLDVPREYFDESLFVRNNPVKSNIMQSNINQYERNKVITISLRKNPISTLPRNTPPEKSYLDESSSRKSASLDLSERQSIQFASVHTNSVKCKFSQNVDSISQCERNKVINIGFHKAPISTLPENVSLKKPCLDEENFKQCASLDSSEEHFDESTSVPNDYICSIKCNMTQTVSNRFHKVMPGHKEKKDIPISALSVNLPQKKTLSVKNNSEPSTSLELSSEHFHESESVQSDSDNNIMCNVVRNGVIKYQDIKNKCTVNTLHKKLRNLRKVNYTLCERVKALNKKISALKSKTTEEKQLEKIIKDDSENKLCAVILLDQIRNFEKKKVTSSSMALKHYMLWHKCSPKGYDFVRNMGIFTLPHEHRLKNSSLISQDKLEHIANVALTSL